MLTRIFWNRVRVDPKVFRFNGLDFPHLQKVEFKYTNLEISNLPISVENLNVSFIRDHYIDVVNKPKLKTLNLHKVKVGTI